MPLTSLDYEFEDSPEHWSFDEQEPPKPTGHPPPVIKKIGEKNEHHRRDFLNRANDRSPVCDL